MSKLVLPLLLAAIGGLAIALSAQEITPDRKTSATPGPSATPPPADPFVRMPGGAPAGQTKPTPEETPVNVLAVLETWSLSQTDLVALLDGPPDESAPYHRLEALAKAGKAKLLGLMAVATKPGQRAVADSIDELRYPTEFKAAARAGELTYPTAYETRNTGETLEVEPNLRPGSRTVDVSLVPQTVRLLGFQDWQPEAGAAAISQPQFQTEKLSTNMAVQSGRPVFLGTATPARAAEGDESARVRVFRASVQQPPPPSAPVADAQEMRIDFLIYSLERETARLILAETTDSVQNYAAVRELVSKGAARLETISAFLNKSGQRAVNEEIFEFRYPVGITPPVYDSQNVPKENRQPASFNSFETRNTGVSVEIEAVLGPDGRFVDINIVPQMIAHQGMIRGTGAAANYPPQPLFTARKLTTSVTGGAGLPVLLGTMSLPRETGVNDRKDDGRTSLAYIRVTPIRP